MQRHEILAMDYPLVSAIVLCYNQARFVTECLDSIKAQNYPNLELLVSDDASKDNSVAVIQAWLDKNSIPYRFFKNEANRGICRTLNHAITQARGKYLAGIASDDIWFPHKTREQVQILERLPEKVGVVFSDALQIDENGKLLPKKFMEADARLDSSGTIPQGNIEQALWRGNFIAPMTTIIRASCYERVGLYDENLFAEDWDMWLRMTRHFDFVYSPEISAKYRIVRTSATRNDYGWLLDDMCKTCLKHLKSGELNKAGWTSATAKLDALASNSFERRSAHYKRNLLKAAMYRPSPGSLARCLFGLTGFRAESLYRIQAAISRKTISAVPKLDA